MIRHLSALALTLIVVAGCATARTKAPPAAPTQWRAVATRDDATRLHDWRDAFVKALAEARAGGHDAAIAREGDLLTPDTALAGAAIPAGRYRCRTLKLGSQGNASGLRYVTYPPFDCRIENEGEVSSFAKMTGSQRPVGLLFSGDDRRMIFLGTLMLGDEMRAIEYGRDRDRDMAGVLERIGPRRWRLLLPYPRFESTLDVIELVPAG